MCPVMIRSQRYLGHESSSDHRIEGWLCNPRMPFIRIKFILLVTSVTEVAVVQPAGTKLPKLNFLEIWRSQLHRFVALARSKCHSMESISSFQQPFFPLRQQ